MDQWTSTTVARKDSGDTFQQCRGDVLLEMSWLALFFSNPLCPLSVLGATDPDRYLQVAAVKTACNPQQTYQAIQGGRKDKLDDQSTELNSLINTAKGSPAHLWYLRT